MLHHPSHVVVYHMPGGVRFVYIPSEVVDHAANAAFADSVGNDLPSTGGRKVDIWSLCFQGGTFDRVKERCTVWLSVAVCIAQCVHIIVCRSIKPVCLMHAVMQCDSLLGQ